MEATNCKQYIGNHPMFYTSS